ncbi:MAG: shikimate dehydrogenase [Chthonomonadaceae bacterium]|nr:shikimate dehydrogenase [Chthonomonadaceae bacterium]
MTTWHVWNEAPAGDFAVIGDPVSHSLSPRMHAAAYTQLGLALTYHAVLVSRHSFESALARLQQLGYRGVNVTVPLKDLALEHQRESSDARYGGLNALDFQRHEGVNTDAPGFLTTVKDLPLLSRSALVLGAGGTGRALTVALLESGFDVHIWNRSRERAEKLVQDFPSVRLADAPRPKGFGLALNTTSSRLMGEDLDIDWEGAEGTVAYDVSYGTGPSQFLRSAQARGLTTRDGLKMLVEQGALSFEWWTGLPAPRDAMWSAVQ